MVIASPQPSGKYGIEPGPTSSVDFQHTASFMPSTTMRARAWHNTFSRSMNAARVRVTSPPDKTYLSPFRYETTHGSRDPAGEAFLSRGTPLGFGNSAGMSIA
jgi:hypothetical protein